MGMLVLVIGIVIIFTLMGKSGPEEIGLLPDGEKPAGGEIFPQAAAAPAQKPSLKPVLRSSPFWILVCCNSLAVLTVMMAFNCQIAYAINKGINDLKAAAALGIIGVSGSCGKLFFGWFCDHVRDAKYAAATGFLIMAAGMVVLYGTDSVAMLYIFAVIYGFGYGSTAPVMPYMILDRFDRSVFGSAYGFLMFFVNGVGGSIGPILGGYIFDKTGSYMPAWLICIVLLLIVTVFILTLKPEATGAAPE
jgi:MFS family permease